MVPVAGLAGDSRPPRAFPDHESGLLGGGQSSSRRGDVDPVGAVQACCDFCQPAVAALEEVGRRLDRLVQQRPEVCGAPRGLGFESQQGGLSVLERPAGDATGLRPGLERDHGVRKAGERGLSVVGEGDDPRLASVGLDGAERLAGASRRGDSNDQQVGGCRREQVGGGQLGSRGESEVPQARGRDTTCVRRGAHPDEQDVFDSVECAREGSLHHKEIRKPGE